MSETLNAAEKLAVLNDAGYAPAWEPPVPIGGEPLPPFPAQALTPVLRDYALAVAESMQVPVDMPAVAALAVVALTVQNKFLIEGKAHWREPLNIYAVEAAPPAERKSAVMQAMTRPVYRYEQDENEHRQPAIDESRIKRSVLTKAVKELEDKAAKSKDCNYQDAVTKQRELSELEEIKPLRLLADDCTPESLASLMADNDGCMAVISAEGGIFEILNGRYSNGINIDTFLKAHAGDPLRVDRKGRPAEYINNPALTVLLAIQPVVLDGMMANDAFRGRGLTARFLYTLPTSKVGARKYDTQPIPREVSAAYDELITSLLDLPRYEEPAAIILSAEAHALSAAFANELEPRLAGDLESIGDWAGKLHGAILRIAGILHTTTHKGDAAQVKVSADTMQAAIDIGNYFLEHAQAAYKLMGADKQTQGAQYIIRQLEKKQYKEITRSELTRLCRGHFRMATDMNPAIEMLVDYGYLREQENEYQGTGRPPAPSLILNPLCSGINGKNGNNSENADLIPLKPLFPVVRQSENPLFESDEVVI